MNISTFLSGMGMSFSLIIAIGAQNAFVLKQGLTQQYVFIVCFICALSDTLLIGAGVYGFSSIIKQSTWLLDLAKWSGILFLTIYGLKSLYQAIKTTHTLTADNKTSSNNLYKTIATCLAFTWLNPHVYLDTVIFLGSIATQFNDKFAFSIGAITASWLFFFSLGFGARFLQPLFNQAITWKILDGLIGIIMLIIAITMLIK